MSILCGRGGGGEAKNLLSLSRKTATEDSRRPGCSYLFIFFYQKSSVVQLNSVARMLLKISQKILKVNSKR